MNKQKIWSVPVALIAVLTMALFFGGITVSADEVGTGTCGENATWSYDDSGTLTIGGSGAMEEFYFQSTPWETYRESITAVVIGNDITHISSNAFNGCSGLSSVTVGTGVKSVGDEAFKGCSGLTTVVFPSGLGTLGDSVFSGCSNLTTVDLGSSLTKIGYAAFKDCGKLSDVTIPSSITTISGEAFSNTAITSLELTAGITSIGKEAFYNCDSLTEINITFTSNEIGFGQNIFSNCGALTTVTFGGTLSNVSYGMFSNCSKLTTVVLPDTVTDIYDYAFNYSEALSSITIPDNLQTIGAYSFSYCKGLTSFEIPSTVTKVGERAFSDSGLTSVTVPATVTTWGSNAFSYCYDLETVTIAQGVTAIPARMFQSCSKMASPQIPSSVTSIGANAFARCEFTSVVIPGNIENMGYNAFNSCEKLKTVTISEGVETIGSYVFSNCTALESVTIPDSLKTIEEGAFSSAGISELTIPDSVTTIGEEAFSYSLITSVTIPGSVETISRSAFDNCSKLKYAELKEGVKVIEESAFHACQALETVIIPSTITSIHKDAFYQCWHLFDVFCKAQPVFEWNEDGNDFAEPRDSKTTVFHVNDGLASQFADNYPDANVTFKDGLTVVPRVVGHSISLSAEIGVNFYIKLPAEYDSSNTVVTFSWGVGDYARSTRGKLTSISQYGANYKVTCDVAARSMGDTITMEVKSGNTVLISDEYSVAKYIDVLIVSRQYEEEYNLCRLLYAMVMYGHYSQVYFNYIHDNDILTRCEKLNLISSEIKNDVMWDKGDLDGVSVDPENMTIKNIADDDIGLAYAANSVLCTSQTKIRFYFRITDQAKFNALTSNYPNLKFVSKNVNGEDLVYLETPGLKAGEIEGVITINIGGKDYTYDFLDYISRVMYINYDFASAAQYMYLYSRYARIYQEGNSNA